MNTDSKTETVKIWDLPTRLFHWSLLLLIIACWWLSTENGNMDWHMRFGYAVLILLLFRLVWGVIGSTTARFSNFVATPRAVLGYFACLRETRAMPHVGHNPAGGWMVLALLGIVLLISTSGLFANDDIMSEGPLAHHVGERFSDLSTALHENSFYILLALVALHLSAILFYLLVKNENLVRPMLTGNKQLPQNSDIPELHTRSGWMALLMLGCASGAVCLLVIFA